MAKQNRRTARLRDAGPFIVQIRIDGTMLVCPAWMGYPGPPPWSRALSAEDESCVEPSRLDRTIAAGDLEKFLNAPYDRSDIDALIEEYIAYRDG